MLLPLYPTDTYVSDRATRFDQINGDLRNSDVVSRNVALNFRPLDHIEPVRMSQQIASPDIAIPSVESGSGTVNQLIPMRT
jgi:hypothetical protein